MRGRGALPSRSIDWFATLARSRSRQPRALCFRKRRPSALLIVVLDCSASMLRAGALARAKGVASAMASQASRRQEAVALIWFGGTRVHVRRATRGRHAALARVVADLGAGGGTPLHGALQHVLTLSRQESHRAADLRVVLLTDGRTRTPLGDLPRLGVELDTTVVDCERTRMRLNRTRPIAARLGARYIHIDELTPTSRSPIAVHAAR